MSNCMKSLVLWLCSLEPYVPLRTSAGRERVAIELCPVLHVKQTQIVQID